MDPAKLTSYRYSVNAHHRAGPRAAATLAAGFLAILSACTSMRQPPRPVADGEDRTGAALARVLVRNETGMPLDIAFRPASGPGGEVGLGRVLAGAESAVAPVPAGEPIILVARTADRRRFELEPRTFAIDAEWAWRILAGTEFREGPRERGP